MRWKLAQNVGMLQERPRERRSLAPHYNQGDSCCMQDTRRLLIGVHHNRRSLNTTGAASCDGDPSIQQWQGNLKCYRRVPVVEGHAEGSCSWSHTQTVMELGTGSIRCGCQSLLTLSSITRLPWSQFTP